MTSQLRTVQSDGLILYSGDVSGVPGHDFMAIELVGGRVQYSFDLGGGSRVLADSGQRLVNDGLWHIVYVSRPTVDRHMLRVTYPRCVSFLLYFNDLYILLTPPEDIAITRGKGTNCSMTKLLDVTYHMGSLCYLPPDTSECAQPYNPSPQSIYLPTPEGWKAELT